MSAKTLPEPEAGHPPSAGPAPPRNDPPGTAPEASAGEPAAPPESAGPPAPEAAPREVDAPPRRRFLTPLLLVLLVAAGVWIALQAQSRRALESRVVELSGELAAARIEIDAYERHLGDVRGHVADLRERLDTLDALVRRDPVPAAPPESP